MRLPVFDCAAHLPSESFTALDLRGDTSSAVVGSQEIFVDTRQTQTDKVIISCHLTPQQVYKDRRTVPVHDRCA